ncbi:MAG: hypothetical protein H8K03_04450 [Nitrospira sp.]|jgi:dihydroxyacetone kinase|nr:hypothetical protein [Nitrospira sp. BO4]
MDRRCSLWVLTFLLVTAGVASAADSQQAERNKGLTVDDLTRGLRSAAQNVEKEIPKIGPAVGKAVKSIGAQGSDKARTPEPASGKK